MNNIVNISLNKFWKPGYTLIRTYTSLNLKTTSKNNNKKQNKNKTNKKHT